MFRSARLKLTLYYLAIIMVISLTFSLFIYQLLSREIDRFVIMQHNRLQNRVFPGVIIIPPNYDIELITDLKRRLTVSLAVVNCTILIVSGISGYFLAGHTLKPIKDMIDDQNRFISDASHELRTPLTSLKSAMEVYLRDQKPKLSEAKQLIRDNISEVDKLQSLSDSLLKLTRYQKPFPVLTFSPTTLASIVTASIKKAKPMADIKHIKITKHLRDSPLRADAASLTDAIVILLDNAIKYSPSHTNISLYASRDDGHYSISVSDRGIGIDQKDIPLIFDRFFRADSARTKNSSGGYGLGLSIAQKIVAAHHGQIAVSSTPGRGSTFTVKIPVKSFS